MNARTLIITAGAVVALAAPTVSNARMLPVKQQSKHVVKKHAAKQHAAKRQGQTRRIYHPAPAGQAATSLQQLQQEQDYNDDLIAHGLAPIDFGNAPDAGLAAPAASTVSETVGGVPTDGTDGDC